MSLEQLLSELGYGNPQLRANAACKLGQLKTPESLNALVNSLNDEEGIVRAACALALAGYGASADVATPRLIEMLRDGFTPARKGAAIALGTIANPAAIKGLTNLIEENRVPKSEAEHCTVMEAVKALGKMQSVQNLQILMKLLTTGYSQAFSDWNLQLRQAAAFALAELDHPEGNRAMLACLYKRENITMRHTLTEALGKLTSEQSFRLLTDALFRRMFEDMEIAWMRQEAAVKALGKQRNRRALAFLPILSASPYPEVRLALIEALVEIGEIDCPEILLNYLRDAMPDVRIAAIKAISKLGLTLAVPPLEVVARDNDMRVANAAKIALNTFRQPFAY
jgi:HEAT repeat protein